MENKSKELEAVIFFSKEDKCFISHSIDCDQIGMGETKLEAIKDLGRALKSCYELAQKDKTIAFYREVPEDIKNIWKTAKNNPFGRAPFVHEVQGYFKITNHDYSC